MGKDKEKQDELKKVDEQIAELLVNRLRLSGRKGDEIHRDIIGKPGKAGEQPFPS